MKRLEWCTRRSSKNSVVLVMTCEGHPTLVIVTSNLLTNATVALAAVDMGVRNSVDERQ